MIAAVIGDGASVDPTVHRVSDDHPSRPVQMTGPSRVVVRRASHRPLGELIPATRTVRLDTRIFRPGSLPIDSSSDFAIRT